MSHPTASEGEIGTVLRLSDRASARAWSRDAKGRDKRVILVPTMGCLHQGHISLVRRAAAMAGEVGPAGIAIIVSIYINPTQFAPGEDLDVYPKQLKADLAALAEVAQEVASPGSGVEIAVFAPIAPLYSASHETWVTVAHLQKPLCGVSRPHFFRGVATIVLKLFHILEPDDAVFGLKDFQQVRVVERMVADLDIPCRIVRAPLVREPDGLAMSSRNTLLSQEHRKAAPALASALLAAQSAIERGCPLPGSREDAGPPTPDDVRAFLGAAIEGSGARVDYAECVDGESLARLGATWEAHSGWAGGEGAVKSDDGAPGVRREVVVAVAAFFGTVRLIDNVICRVDDGRSARTSAEDG